MIFWENNKFCAWSLSLFLLGTTPACDLGVSSPVVMETQQQTQQEILQALTQADIVYLGETHNSEADHQAQLEILEALYQENPQIVLALEMFQRPFQNVLDKYLAGEITEAELIARSEYEQRWGFPWEYYAPLLRFAKENQLPVLALNTPSEITRQVARNGLTSLTPDQQKYIPPLAEIRLDNDAYRAMIQTVYQAHHQGGHGNSEGFDNFFAAQVLWDETMAEKIAQFAQTNPEHQIIVIAGQGHVIYGYGIPSRVARRLANENVVQSSVLFSQSPGQNSENQAKIADYFWQH
ncbi:MAG: ChaN family lipoprotein [Oscillatoria sp. PMC 1068.18]|nr:ChaN family lipoprotein [Oscillatoria sp. PMC 1076.18]MEC4988145.1 ChaN family lipoprotein [Oscillatoria sp. PMC 1068.18]